MSEPITVYKARVVHTMDKGRPIGEAIAVRGDRIRAVGTVEELMSYPNTTLDERFADSVLMPGFVEAHSHTMGALLWKYPYIGYFDRRDPAGTVWTGCGSIDSALDRLREVEEQMDDPEAALIAWGFDAIYFSGERLVAAHLDKVSSTRPMLVLHASGHVATVNSATIEQCGIADNTDVTGVVTDENGFPNGELQEPAAMSLANLMQTMYFGGSTSDSVWATAREAANVGCTTLVDLGQPRVADPAYVDEVVACGDDPAFPVRLSVFLMGGSAIDEVEVIERIRDLSTDHIRFGHVKLVLDGSIQQFTARLLPPGYFDRDTNGIWVTAPETFREIFCKLHAAGITIHVHCNGDEASELFLDVLEEALERHPRWNHRHTMTHSQLTTAAQYRRLAALGGCANIFANHIWYWGDQHRDRILGPDRASRMDAAATALAAGVPITLHCDTPVTPLNPLATVSYAVNRITPTGELLGGEERISVYDALEAVTLGGAYTIKMDSEVGSLQAGKYADIAILDADPFEVEPTEIASIKVLATMSGGRIRETGAE